MEAVQRRAFFGVVGLAALPGPSAAADVCVPDSPQQMIEQNQARAEKLLQLIGKYGDHTEVEYARIVRQEIALRFDLATYLDAHTSDESILRLIKVEHLKGLEALVPPDQTLTKPALLPVRELARRAGQTAIDPTSPKLAKPCPESVPDVLIDMFLEVMDLQEVGGVFKRAVNESPQLRGAFQELAAAVDIGNWQKLLDALTKLFDLLGKGALAKTVWDKLGKKAADELKAKLLRSFLARLVPFVGQVYLLISVAAAVMANRKRLVTMVGCRRDAGNSVPVAPASPPTATASH